MKFMKQYSKDRSNVIFKILNDQIPEVLQTQD